MDFGKKLRFLRLMQGVSQTALASLVGTSPPYLARYEASINRPKRDATLMLAQSLRVSVEWFDYCSGAPFLFRVWAPLREKDTKKHRAAIIRGAETLFPEFLSSNKILCAVRHVSKYNVHYLIAFKALDTTGKLADETSIVIIFVDEELDKILMKCCDDCQIDVGERDNSLLSVTPDADSLEVFESYLEAISKTLPGIDVCKYSHDFSKSENFEGQKRSWTFSLNVEVISDKEITRKEAQKQLYDAIENLDFKSNQSLKIILQNKSTTDSTEQS
ncbi:helix-turn-helix domain-containing protein [Geomonas nitrogeniifigens]|uniref:Helix-turn-helix domain-containing protein n=1 Tax=Geomonas diazotrophica TaxID=2843197 RepID=A0ABX8JJM4_9BACT|nr:helix-turn-helix transcriptional regulator [Geomonas nitrogeniifigens]QWV98584.1 helix-turn-helix domain-containing protein [Geomonas nitrogeniifigens]